MARIAVALTLAIAAAFAPLTALQAQTSNSIEDAPGYRTVPEAEPVEATIGSPGVFGTTDTDPYAPDPYSSGVLPSDVAIEERTDFRMPKIDFTRRYDQAGAAEVPGDFQQTGMSLQIDHPS